MRLTRALVIGAAGQDGSYLCEQLLADGVEVFTLTRSGLRQPGDAAPRALALGDRAAIFKLIAEGAFDEIYFLAAHHHSAQDRLDDRDIVRHSFAVHVDGLIHVLDALVAANSRAGLFYAASSHIFGLVAKAPQNEETPRAPICAYGISKTAGLALCGLYRRTYGLRANVGILYNHESPRRAPSFLSRKVAIAVAAIKRGQQAEVRLGNLDALLDWGYAPEYTEAMRRILAQEEGGDFIIASGRAGSVRDFVSAAFARAGLDWRDHVRVDPAMLQKIERGPLVGDPTNLMARTGWRARTTLAELAALMVDAELARGGAGS